jgi:hypothetical protein
MEIYKDLAGQDCISWTDENGTIHSMLKSTYDQMQAEQSTPIVTGEATSD